MRLKYYIALFSLTALAAACGGSSASNSNVTVTSSTNATGNSNFSATANSNSAPPAKQAIEVPTFDNAQAALDAGKNYFTDNEDEAAVKAIEQAVKLDPNLAEAHLYLAFANDALENEEQGEKSYKEAIKLYQKVTAKTPKDAAAHYNLGRAYDRINEDLKAEKSLKQAVKLNAEDTEYRYEYGAILVKLAQYTEAIRELKKSLELDSQNTRAEELLERAEAGEIRVKDAQAKNKKAAQEKTASGGARPKTGKKTSNEPAEEEAPKPTTSSANSNKS